MSTNLDHIIDIQNLTKEYNNKIVIDNINLKIEDSCFALLGPNGAGKTTTILMILGLVKPSAGNINILGKKIPRDFKFLRKKIGFLPENVGFYSKLTGRENLELFCRLRNKSRDIKKETIDLLKWCGIGKEYWDKKTFMYSRGMCQRLGLAQAFAGNPKIIFLDEPLSNIDPLGREDLIQKIGEKREEGTVIIISSHIVQELEQLSDFIAIIDKGTIKISGRIIDLALKFGLNEFQISYKYQHSHTLIKGLYQKLISRKSLFYDKPTILSDKIIVKSDVPYEIEALLKGFKYFRLKLIDGALIKIYKKVIKHGV